MEHAASSGLNPLRRGVDRRNAFSETGIPDSGVDGAIELADGYDVKNTEREGGIAQTDGTVEG